MFVVVVFCCSLVLVVGYLTLVDGCLLVDGCAFFVVRFWLLDVY